jgi:hypothetical protein
VPLLAVPALAPVPGLLVRGLVAIAIFVLTLLLTGFFRASEWQWFREICRRFPLASEHPAKR